MVNCVVPILAWQVRMMQHPTVTQFVYPEFIPESPFQKKKKKKEAEINEVTFNHRHFFFSRHHSFFTPPQIRERSRGYCLVVINIPKRKLYAAAFYKGTRPFFPTILMENYAKHLDVGHVPPIQSDA